MLEWWLSQSDILPWRMLHNVTVSIGCMGRFLLGTENIHEGSTEHRVNTFSRLINTLLKWAVEKTQNISYLPLTITIISRKSISPLASTLPSHLYMPSSLLLMLRICRLLLANMENRSGEEGKSRERFSNWSLSPVCSKLLNTALVWHYQSFHQQINSNLKVKCNFMASASLPYNALLYLFSKIHSRLYIHIKQLGHYFPFGALNTEMTQNRTMQWD